VQGLEPSLQNECAVQGNGLFRANSYAIPAGHTFIQIKAVSGRLVQRQLKGTGWTGLDTKAATRTFFSIHVDFPGGVLVIIRNLEPVFYL